MCSSEIPLEEEGAGLRPQAGAPKQATALWTQGPLACERGQVAQSGEDGIWRRNPAGLWVTATLSSLTAVVLWCHARGVPSFSLTTQSGPPTVALMVSPMEPCPRLGS